MSIFNEQHTPAEIVNIFPKASDLFREHDINFCCNGDRPLHIVLEEKNLKGNDLLQELNTRYEDWSSKEEKANDWEAMALSEIVDYILKNYHTFLDEELDRLEQFVTRVYFRHGADQPHLVSLYNLYVQFKDELEDHVAKEEKEVFPLIQAYEENPTEERAVQIRKMIINLEKEHENEVSVLNKLRQVTNAFSPPATACNTYRITYARLAELEENTLQHVHVENNILLKRLKEIQTWIT